MDNSVVEVSIITPLYKGSKYINNIVSQIENAKAKLEKNVELIFVNDYTDEVIEDVYSEKLIIKVINNDHNEGIHASRKIGFNKSTGKYIVFLDQDDCISPDFLKSQIDCILDADFCVCRLINGDHEHYTDSFKFEEVVTKDFMMHNWCSIVSPGQVLLRRDAIPKVWIDNQIYNNGADDYFLWIAMFGLGRKVQLNDDILFTHRITGVNTSSNTNQMMNSEEEVINILIQSGIFNQDEKNDLNRLKTNLRRIHIKQLDNLVTAYAIREALLEADNEVVSSFFVGKIAIYGAADVGRALYKGLVDNGINPIFIDRNAKYINDLPVRTLEQMPDDFDLMIVAINDQDAVNDIKRKVKKICNCNIISVHELMSIIKNVNKI